LVYALLNNEITLVAATVGVYAAAVGIVAAGLQKMLSK
jgi:hypothetical protein